jgi:hypothetical protein
MGDYRELVTPRFLGTVVLVTLGLIALGILAIRGVHALNRHYTGWKALTQKFPATDVHKFGGRYKRQSAFIGNRQDSDVSGQFLIELAQEGLLVTANFSRDPLLIPWSAIRDVEEMNVFGWTQVRLTVDYESRLVFLLPKAALAEIHGNIPADRFHQSDFWEKLKQVISAARDRNRHG